jgi:hypothetical protein
VDPGKRQLNIMDPGGRQLSFVTRVSRSEAVEDPFEPFNEVAGRDGNNRLNEPAREVI